MLGSGAFGSVSLGLNLDTGAMMAVKEVRWSAGRLDQIRLLQRKTCQLHNQRRIITRGAS